MGANDKVAATFHDGTDEQIMRLFAAVRKQAARDAVVEEVEHELDRQDDKWGEQNHPNGTGPSERLFGYNIWESKYPQLAERAKATTDYRAARGTVTYADIFLEEVFEALAEDDPAKLRAELIQCAAVAVAWVQKIDRDTAKKAE